MAATASDGQNLWSQDKQTQSMFINTYGDDQLANEIWVAEHEAQLKASGGGGTGGGGDGGGGGDDEYFNPQAANYALQAATQAAQAKYLEERLKLETKQFQFMSAMEKDKFAFEKAKEKFDQTYRIAELTGTYKGKPTWQKIVQESGLTGYYEGENTLQRDQFEQQTNLGYLNLLAQLRGPRNAFQFAKVLNGTPQGLRDILSAAAGNFQIPGFGGGNPNVQTEGMTLEGLWQDAVSGQMGGYTPNGPPTPYGPYAPNTPPGAPPVAPPPGVPAPPPAPGVGATPIVAPPGTPAPPGSGGGGGGGRTPPPDRYRDTTQEGGRRGGPQGGPGRGVPQGGSPPSGGGRSPVTTESPPGVQAPVTWYNYEPNGDGGQTIYPPGNAAPPQNPQLSSQTPLGGTQPTTAGGSLPLPSTWNPKNIKNMNPYQRDLMLGAYEYAGWDPDAAWNTFLGSLPDYGGPARGNIAGVF